MLLLTLLIANALFFGWRYWAREVESRQPADASESAPRLLLASERPKSPPQPAAPAPGPGEPEPPVADPAAEETQESPAAAGPDGESPAGPEPAPPPLVCFSLGYFTDADTARRAESRLAERGLTTRSRSTEGAVWSGYWVFIPPFPDRERARAAMATLRQQGLGESYIVPGGDNRNAVSLGILSDRDRADLLAERGRAMGFDARVTDYERTGTTHWIDVMVSGPEAIDPLEFQADADRISRLRLKPCPASPPRLPDDAGD